MNAWNRSVTVESADPGSPQASLALRGYFEDMVSRNHGRPASAVEVLAAMQEEPSDDLVPPWGLFLVARVQATGRVVGCVGLRLRPGGVGEVARLHVAADLRRRGLGTWLLARIEERARELGVRVLRQDMRRDLVEARRLYPRHGFREVPAFSSGPHADHWFEKLLR